jgi:hypothetical protein
MAPSNAATARSTECSSDTISLTGSGPSNFAASLDSRFDDSRSTASAGTVSVPNSPSTRVAASYASARPTAASWRDARSAADSQDSACPISTSASWMSLRVNEPARGGRRAMRTASGRSGSPRTAEQNGRSSS